ncbi:MAG: ABC transporter permease [Candidatus Kaelpia imicola]|nr:ABC transporter permease [Candidatus Kaelpia imicola]
MERELILKNIKNLKELTVRNIRLKYASTLLGVAWAGLIPLLLMGVIGFVFIRVFGVSKENFHVFVLSALIPWLYFSNVIVESTEAFMREKSIMNQFDFSKIIYPLSIVLSNTVEHIIAILFLLPVFIFFNKALIFKFPLLVLPILIAVVFAAALSLMAAIVTLYFRDFRHLLGVLLMALFWLTPVFYSPYMVPENIRFLIFLNPLTYFIELYRGIFIAGYNPFLKNTYLYVLIIGVISVLFGFLLYRKTEREILKRN